MRYLGGKTRLAKHLAKAILDDTKSREVYVEPMVGGGSVLAAMAPHFERAYAGDVHEDLILMYQAMQRGWEPPREISENQWRELKYSEPSPLRGFAGFGCSFAGRWFNGYARDSKGTNYAAQAARKLAKQKVTATFFHTPFDRWPIKDGHVVYLDPPYQNLLGYGGTKPFDHKHFWDTARRWREKGAHVYVSEFSAPDDWTCIWEKERSVGVGQQNNADYRTEVEKLFK